MTNVAISPVLFTGNKEANRLLCKDRFEFAKKKKSINCVQFDKVRLKPLHALACVLFSQISLKSKN